MSSEMHVPCIQSLDFNYGGYYSIQNNMSTNNHIQLEQIQTDCFSPINSIIFNSDNNQARIFSMDADFDAIQYNTLILLCINDMI